MDEISFKILKILQEKARIPNVEVSRQVGLAPSAVLERIRKLEKQGIIEGYEVRLNPKYFTKSLVAFVTVVTAPGKKGDRAGGLFVGQILVARGQSTRLAVAWLSGLAAAAGAVLITTGTDPVTRVGFAFVVGEVVALTALVWGAVLTVGPEERDESVTFATAKRTLDIAVALVLQ